GERAGGVRQGSPHRGRGRPHASLPARPVARATRPYSEDIPPYRSWFFTQMPALALAAVPGRRRATIELAKEIERRGFQGIYCASFGDSMGLCLSLAHETKEITFGPDTA